jgi:hypothetical protein
MLSIFERNPESKVVWDVENYAGQIEFELAKYILPAPTGLYIKNVLEPVMTSGNSYYTYNKKNLPVLCTDVTKATGNVYNADYKVIIPGMYLLNKEKYLSNYCMLPYRGLKIVELMIKDDIYNQSSYLNRSNDFINKLQSHLIPIESDEVLNEIHNTLIKICKTLLVDLELFVSKDTWHIYRINLTNRILNVEKIIDYRISEWERMQAEKLESDAINGY